MQIRLSSPPVASRNVNPSEIDERIRQRAYEIYQARGREDGNHALEDWLQAKEEVLDTRRKAHAA